MYDISFSPLLGFCPFPLFCGLKAPNRLYVISLSSSLYPSKFYLMQECFDGTYKMQLVYFD